MKLKYSFEIVDMGNEIIAVPVGNNADQIKGVIKLNKEGLEIFNLLKVDSSEDSIIHDLIGKYENAPESIANYVHGFVTYLKQQGLLVE